MSLNKVDKNTVIDIMHKYQHQSEDNTLELPKESFSVKEYGQSLFNKYKDGSMRPSCSLKQIRSDYINNKIKQIEELID